MVPFLMPNPAAVARQGFLFLLARNCRMLPSKASKASNPSKASKRAKPALGAAKRRTLNRAKPALRGKRRGPFLVPNPAAVARQGFLFLLARNCRMLPSKASKASNPSKASKCAKPALGAAKRRTLKRAKPALGVSRTGSCGKRSGPFSSARPSGCGTPRLSFSTGPKLPDAPFSFKSLKPFKSLETCQNIYRLKWHGRGPGPISIMDGGGP